MKKECEIQLEWMQPKSERERDLDLESRRLRCHSNPPCRRQTASTSLTKLHLVAQNRRYRPTDRPDRPARNHRHYLPETFWCIFPLRKFGNRVGLSTFFPPISQPDRLSFRLYVNDEFSLKQQRRSKLQLGWQEDQNNDDNNNNNNNIIKNNNNDILQHRHRFAP